MINPIFQHIRDDLRNGRNANMLIVGAPRSGKSWTALRLAEIVDEHFTIDQVVWDIPQFMSLINSDKVHDGSVVIFDEAGVSINARDWYEKMNKKAMMILQTYGYKHLCVIFTTPSISYVDSQSRRLFNYTIETTNRYGMVKLRVSQYNPVKDKTYNKQPTINGIAIPVMYLNRPSRKLCGDYERLSIKWKNKLSKEIEEEFKAASGKEISIDEVVAEVRKNPQQFTTVYRNKRIVDSAILMNHFRISYHKARQAKSILGNAYMSDTKV